MADSAMSMTLDKLKKFWKSEVQDDRAWDTNMKVLRAAGLFAGSIFLMRNFGDLMAV